MFISYDYIISSLKHRDCMFGGNANNNNEVQIYELNEIEALILSSARFILDQRWYRGHNSSSFI